MSTVTTNDFRELEEQFPVRVFCSNLNGRGKVRITIKANPDAANMHDDSETLMQGEFSKWSRIPSEVYTQTFNALEGRYNG